MEENNVMEEWLKGNVVWYDVHIKNISQVVTCPRGTKLGQEWVVGLHTPEGFCHGAWNNLYPYVRALQNGAVFPWSSDPDVVIVNCPDRVKIATYELRRLRDSVHPVDAPSRRVFELQLREDEKKEIAEGKRADPREMMKNLPKGPGAAIWVAYQEGPCRLGHKVGDRWIIKEEKTPEGMCAAAFASIWPQVQGFLYGASYLWEIEPGGASRGACPNAYSKLHFEIRMLPK